MNGIICDVVISIRSKDGEYHTTSYFPQVTKMLYESQRTELEEVTDTHLVVRGRSSLGVNLDFTAITDEESEAIMHYVDNNVAKANLDFILATFTKEERLQLCKDYISENEGV